MRDEIEHQKTQENLKFYEFSYVQLNLTLRWLNLIARKLSNESLKWNSSLPDIYLISWCYPLSLELPWTVRTED